MSEPIFDTSTERLYDRGLPIHYRSEDANLDWVLKRWLSGIGGQQNEVDTIIERFSYTPPEDGVPHDTSDLVNPITCDFAWLPWLAQLVGVKLDGTLSPTDQRNQVDFVNFFRGTKQHMAQAAQKVLTGDKHVTIFDHTITSSAIGAAGQWDMLVITLASETVSDPVAAIIAANAKPAGVNLLTETFTSTWDDVEAAHPDWTSWDATSWTGIEESGL